jgi:hypothetical protein
MGKEMYHKAFKVCQFAEIKGHLTHEVGLSPGSELPLPVVMTHEVGLSPGSELPLPVVMTVEDCIFLLLATQSKDLAGVAVSAAGL